MSFICPCDFRTNLEGKGNQAAAPEALNWMPHACCVRSRLLNSVTHDCLYSPDRMQQRLWDLTCEAWKPWPSRLEAALKQPERAAKGTDGESRIKNKIMLQGKEGACAIWKVQSSNSVALILHLCCQSFSLLWIPKAHTPQDLVSYACPSPLLCSKNTLIKFFPETKSRPGFMSCNFKSLVSIPYSGSGLH